MAPYHVVTVSPPKRTAASGEAYGLRLLVVKPHEWRGEVRSFLVDQYENEKEPPRGRTGPVSRVHEEEWGGGRGRNTIVYLLYVLGRDFLFSRVHN